VQVRTGDGYLGWKEAAPFDGIIVACSPERVPPPLIDQLREGGRIVIPLGAGYEQMIYVLTKTNGMMLRESVASTVFVPMSGRAEREREKPRSPTAPTLNNPSFESVLGGSLRPTGWYHQRQIRAMPAGGVPDGGRFALFENRSPGRTAETSQAIGLDGRRCRGLVISGWVKGDGIARGPGERERASIVLAFYNARREMIGAVATGDWEGTFGWRGFEETVEVPTAAREAVLRIGLCGATGSLSVDGLGMAVLK
jgi:protein-L-isoaspartate(D-aspartate) O-methyltransferase